MDLKKEITFGSKKTVYPTKKHLNLVKKEASKRSTALELALFGIFLILLVIAAKFLIVDPLLSVSDSSAELDSAQKELDALKADNSSFSELTDTYARYVVADLTEKELSLANRDELITLVKTKVMTATNLSSVKVTGNSLVITCTGVGLQDVAGLVASLESDDLVSYVTVPTTQSQDSKGSSATIEVTFKGAASDATASTDASQTEGTTDGK